MKLTRLLEELDDLARSGALSEEASALVFYDILSVLSGKGVRYGAGELARYDGIDCVRGNELYDLATPERRWLGLDEGPVGFEVKDWFVMLEDGPSSIEAIASGLAEKTGFSLRKVKAVLRRIENGIYRGAEEVLSELYKMRPDFFLSCRGVEGQEEHLEYLASCFLRCCRWKETHWGINIWKCLSLKWAAANAWVSYLQEHGVRPRDREVSGRIFAELLSARASYSARGMSMQTCSFSCSSYFERPWRNATLPEFQINIMESMQCFEECEEGLFLFGILSFRFLLALLKVRDFLWSAQRRYHFMEKGGI